MKGMHHRKLLFLVWLCFLVRGIFYCALIPIWEGFDEPSHFSFLQYLVVNHKLPLRTDPISREVEASLHRLPISWEQRLHSIAPPVYTQDTYWQLPEAQRPGPERGPAGDSTRRSAAGVKAFHCDTVLSYPADQPEDL